MATIGSNPPLNLNIQISNLQAGQAADVKVTQEPSHNEVSAGRSLGGRAVKLIADVAVWAAKGIGHLARETARDFKDAVVFVGKKFAEGVKALHSAYKDYSAHKAAMKELRSTPAAVVKHTQSPSTQAAEKLRPPSQEASHAAHPRRIDRETRDIQDRLNLLKLPDVPTHDPNVAKPR
jgi:hypothetical protein